MRAQLQRRIQRYGWDAAAAEYEALWRAPLAAAHSALLQAAALAPGERVLDVACGTGLVTLAAARAVGAAGQVHGVDLSGRMVEGAARRAREAPAGNIASPTFERMDAEALAFPDASFDVVLCALGLMYVPDPERALAEMRRVLRPGGRLVLAVWGERARCGWAPVFNIVDAEVRSEVCPLFFRLGQPGTLPDLCAQAGLLQVREWRCPATLVYASGEQACDAALVGGPVALAWSRFGAEARARVQAGYLAAIAPWRRGDGYHVPAEFVVVAGYVGR